MKFIDLFAGIGGFRIGMEMAGHKCVGWCEIDKYAQQSYRAIHDTEGEWFADDITKVNPDELPEFDCICAGFPCQAFSVAGQRRGFEDTRGTLFFEIARIAKARRPAVLFLENVKGLLNHDSGRTFATILLALDELGYDAEWQVLNAKNFGVPQNRERVFIVGSLRGAGRRKVFPFLGFNPKTIRRIQGDVSGKGYGSQENRLYRVDGIMACIPHARTKTKVKIYLGNGVSRSLTPLECWRVQGQLDENFYKAKNTGLTDDQLYSQAGNSVPIPPVYEIAKRLEAKE